MIHCNIICYLLWLFDNENSPRLVLHIVPRRGSKLQPWRTPPEVNPIESDNSLDVQTRVEEDLYSDMIAVVRERGANITSSSKNHGGFVLTIMVDSITT